LAEKGSEGDEGLGSHGGLGFDALDDFCRRAGVELHDSVGVHGFEIENRRADCVGFTLGFSRQFLLLADGRFECFDRVRLVIRHRAD
jgi:hypothetical protein